MRSLLLLALILSGCDTTPTNDAGTDASTRDAPVNRDAPVAVDAPVGGDAPVAVDAPADLDALVLADAPEPVDAPSDPDGGVPETLLRNADFAACDTYATLPTALPDEMNHLTANRLTPSTYPFTVRQVGYFLELSSEDGQCNAGFAHRVDLYVTSDASPPNEPGAALVASIEVPAATEPFAAVVEGARSLRHTLPTPITLVEGQHLYIAVQLTAGTPNPDGAMTQSLCASGCFGGAEAGTMFWSNAATVPYAWADLLTDFGIDFELGAWASSEITE